MSIGEATSTFPAHETDVTQIFKSFYNGLTKSTIVWYAYDDIGEYELPTKFVVTKV